MPYVERPGWLDSIVNNSIGQFQRARSYRDERLDREDAKKRAETNDAVQQLQFLINAGASPDAIASMQSRIPAMAGVKIPETREALGARIASTPEVSPSMFSAIPGMSAMRNMTTPQAPGISDLEYERAGYKTPDARRLEQKKRLVEGQQLDITAQNLPITGQAAEAATQDPVFNTVADRVVRDLWVKTKKLPTPQDALSAGQKDIRAKAYGDQINEPYYGAAVERLRAQLEAEQTAQLHAQAARRNAYGASNDTSKVLVAQQTQYNNRIKTLQDENEAQEKSLSAFAKIPGQDVKTLSPTDQAALDIIGTNRQLINQYRKALADLDIAGAALAGGRTEKTGSSEGSPEGGVIKQRADWDTAAQQIKNDPKFKGKTPEQVLGPRP